ncbi:helix-turn-helix domain-containing protein [Asticcacaulis sp. AC402]|uniref:helix-turn-helix domain-containing protein n=1 Tax=Asticcacaulis sp. AC402 TaxID=1282361 RepID=UPI0003C4043D|nr:helix-turn-helix transcriptional regulator [Asticcacaulis sp. AC402]ESQ77087.1 Cro/Cl family transcriptional regulator [Asticcacaulis sp. AC402]
MSNDNPGEGGHPVDLHVGSKVRLRRKQLGLSQTVLAEAIHLTFQQVQKYERGANRISASKLFEIAQFLDAPIAYFFDGLDDRSSEDAPLSAAEVSTHAFLVTGEGLELAQVFPRLKSAKTRRRILDLVRTIADA